MDRKKVLSWMLNLGLVLLLFTACSTPQPAAMSQPTATPEPPTWDIVDGSVTSTAFGTFNGVSYVQYTGQFIGTEAGDFAVGFEIVAPDDPAQGNGVLVMEPMHIMGGTAGRDAYLTREFLFGRGFSYAGIWWHPADVNPMTDYSVEDANEILHNFVLALRQDPEIQAMVGPLEKLYGLGVSKTNEPLLTFLASPNGGLLDFSLLVAPDWQEETFTPPEGANYIIAFQVEGDHVQSAMNGTHTQALRGISAKYRSYEIAGGPHMPDVPWVREVGPDFGIASEGTTPLDWTPVLRALFIAGHQWATEGTEPPSSTYLKDADTGQTDPLYQNVYTLTLETGIRRDPVGNALGGIRLPDLAIGRGLYIAADPNSPLALLGAFQDLQCIPLSDGSSRFPDHTNYVARYTRQVESLVNQHFLLPEDAEQMTAAATASDVGSPAACLSFEVPVWDYVALGASKVSMPDDYSYVTHYAAYIEADLGVKVIIHNKGVPALRTFQLLYSLQNDQTLRDLIREAEVVTVDMGSNDLAFKLVYEYTSGTCGGDDNKDCIREMYKEFRTNYDAILDELLTLCAPNTIIRVSTNYAGNLKSYGYDGETVSFYKPLNEQLIQSAAERNIPVARVDIAFNGPTGDENPKEKGYILTDGQHPTELGAKVMADAHRALGYEPTVP